MSARAEQSFTRPVSQAIAEGATTPNAGAAGAVALSSTTGGFMRWTGSAWTSTAGAAVHTAQGTVDFGHPTSGEDSTAVVTVAATWVTTSSVIVCTPAAATTADHDPEDVMVEGITAYAGNLVAATSFDIYAAAPGGSWGRYLINAVGG